MITVIQRVTNASVKVDNQTVGSINQGIAALVAVEKEDEETYIQRLAERLLNYRIFSDDQGRMNLSVRDIHGGILLIPQFTLAANTEKGMRPSFSSAAPPAEGKQIFEWLVNIVKAEYKTVECGVFGANMQVELINDGPVTFILK